MGSQHRPVPRELTAQPHHPRPPQPLLTPVPWAVYPSPAGTATRPSLGGLRAEEDLKGFTVTRQHAVPCVFLPL